MVVNLQMHDNQPKGGWISPKGRFIYRLKLNLNDAHSVFGRVLSLCYITKLWQMKINVSPLCAGWSHPPWTFVTALCFLPLWLPPYTLSHCKAGHIENEVRGGCGDWVWAGAWKDLQWHWYDWSSHYRILSAVINSLTVFSRPSVDETRYEVQVTITSPLARW